MGIRADFELRINGEILTAQIKAKGLLAIAIEVARPDLFDNEGKWTSYSFELSIGDLETVTEVMLKKLLYSDTVDFEFQYQYNDLIHQWWVCAALTQWIMQVDSGEVLYFG